MDKEDSAAPLSARSAPEPRAFRGCVAELRPTSPERDAELLWRAASGDPEVWRFMPCGPFRGMDDYAAFLREWAGRRDLIAFTALAAGSEECVGTISLMSVRPADGVAELGNIWYRPEARRTGINTESCFLLLRYCFEELGYRRMEWKCDARNAPSRRAAERLGFRAEGVFRQHMIVKGENRDTAWFSMLDREWPAVRDAMSRWLAGDGREPLRVVPD